MLFAWGCTESTPGVADPEQSVGDAAASSSGAGGETAGGDPAGAAGIEAAGGSVAAGGSAGTASTSGCTTTTVRDLFRASCGLSACHDATAPAASLDLTLADPGSLAGVSSEICAGWELISAGDPQSSLIWNKLTAQTPACGVAMPIGTTLGQAELECVSQWIVNLASGTVDCETCGGSSCVDLASDQQNCGGCGVACDPGQVCDGGQCVGCGAEFTGCGNECVDLQSNANHCGACGTPCGTGQACEAGECSCVANSASFASDVAPLLEASCTSRGCHGAPRPKEDLDLGSSASFADMVGVTSSQCGDLALVEPGAPEQSYLINKLTGVDLCSGTLMPKGGIPFSETQIAMIAGWICAGAPMN